MLFAPTDILTSNAPHIQTHSQPPSPRCIPTATTGRRTDTAQRHLCILPPPPPSHTQRGAGGALAHTGHPLRVRLEGTSALLPYQHGPTRTSLSPALLPDPPFPILSPLPSSFTIRLSPFASSRFFTQERLLLKCITPAALELVYCGYRNSSVRKQDPL